MNPLLLQYLQNAFTTPGSGVYTVHTGQEKRIKVHTSLYPATDNFDQAWVNSLSQYEQHSGVAVYGISSDSGGGIQRGANWGPLALREYIYTRDWTTPWSQKIFDLGDVRVNPQLLRDEYLNEQTIRACKNAMYGDPHSQYPVSPLNIASEFLSLHHQTYPNRKLLMLGGDHSVSYASVGEFLQAKKEQKKKAAVLHFDAHTDLLDQRLGIEVCFGSWVSHVLPKMTDRNLFIQLGIRSSGHSKLHWEKLKGVKQFWSDEMSNIDSTIEAVLQHLRNQKAETIYVSFDIDALDASEAGATGTPERNGLKTEDCIQIIEKVSEEFSIDGADLTEVAPFVHHHNGENEPENTLKNAAKIIHCLTDAMGRSPRQKVSQT